MKYSIFTRYQYRCSVNNPESENGLAWSKWFRKGNYKDTKEELKDDLKNFKEIVKNTDKYTKLKHEFKIDLFDETTIPVYTTLII